MEFEKVTDMCNALDNFIENEVMSLLEKYEEGDSSIENLNDYMMLDGLRRDLNMLRMGLWGYLHLAILVNEVEDEKSHFLVEKMYRSFSKGFLMPRIDAVIESANDVGLNYSYDYRLRNVTDNTVDLCEDISRHIQRYTE